MSKKNDQFEKWSTEYVNDLPDSAFMYIEDGGEKDDDGKTTPRELRHLPFKDKEGNIDLPHVRNALARLDQVKKSDGSELSEEKKKEIREKLEKMLEENKTENSKPSSENEDNEETKDSNEFAKKKLLKEKDFFRFVASQYQGLDENDVASLFENQKYIDINLKELATVLANIKGISAGDALNYLENAECLAKEDSKYSKESDNNDNFEKDLQENKDESSNTDSKSYKTSKEIVNNNDSTSEALEEALRLNDDMISTLNESRKEIEDLKALNKDYINRIETKDKELSHAMEKVAQFEEEKKQNKVEDVFQRYCSFFDVPESDKDRVKEMLSTMSEDMLEEQKTLFSQKEKNHENMVAQTKPSANLAQFGDSKQKEQKEEKEKADFDSMSKEEKTRYLFRKYVAPKNEE